MECSFWTKDKEPLSIYENSFWTKDKEPLSIYEKENIFEDP